MTDREQTFPESGVTLISKDYELDGVRLRDVYRDDHGDVWEVVALCDRPTVTLVRVVDGVKAHHVINCPNMRRQFPEGPLR